MGEDNPVLWDNPVRQDYLLPGKHDYVRFLLTKTTSVAISPFVGQEGRLFCDTFYFNDLYKKHVDPLLSYSESKKQSVIIIINDNNNKN